MYRKCKDSTVGCRNFVLYVAVLTCFVVGRRVRGENVPMSNR